MGQKNLKTTLNMATLIVACVCLIGFVVFAILVGCDYQFKIDNFNGWIAKNRTETATEFFETITSLGSFYVVGFIVVIAFLIIAFQQKKVRLSVFMCGAFGFVSILNMIIKYIFKRPRPELYMIIDQTGYSFASGHSVMATSLFLLAIYYVFMHVKNKPLKIILSSLFGILIALVCFSRIYLGVHYLSDVLAGMLLASGCVLLFMLAYKTSIFKFLKDGQDKPSPH